jgi:hypothetical protein
MELLENFKNFTTISVICYTAYSLYNFYIYNNYEIIHSNIEVINYYLWGDLFICKKEMYFHHLLVIKMIDFYKKSISHIPGTEEYIPYILLAELSSFWLILNIYIEYYKEKYKNIKFLNIVYILNFVFFILTFTYIRIYIFGKKIIYNNLLYIILYEKLDNYDYYTFITLLYSFYFLNIYWFMIIIKKIVKLLNNNGFLLLDVTCEKILQYTYLSSFIYSIYRYGCSEVKYYFDIFGIFLLTMTSYLFHNSIYNQLIILYPDEKYSIYDDRCVMYYIYDGLGIKLRSFLFLLSSNISYSCIFLLGFINLMSGYLFYNNVKNRGNIWKNKYLIGTSILTDMIMIIMNTTDFYTRTNLIICLYLFFIIKIVCPFYQMNHLAFHLLLFIQTILLCESNISENNLNIK